MLVVVFVAASCKDSADADNPKAQFDKLEKVFETGNWRHITYGDTSYLFFSREGATDYKIYRYYMVDGDSVSTVVFNIVSKNDSVIMKVNEDYRELVSVSENGSSWQDKENLYKFTKLDSLHIQLQTNGVEADTLERTLPISAFLLRSKDDFKNGTKNATALVDTVRSRK